MDSTQGTEKLTVDVCTSYIDSVIDYIKSEYGKNVKISFFAISFGAFVLLNKLIGDRSKYENIVLRSPAFKMKDIFKNCLLKEPFTQYKESKKAKAGHRGKIEVPYSFYEDLTQNDLYSKYREKRKIALEELADKLTRTVIRTGKQVTLEPMSAYERKIIHNRLQSSQRVKTFSVGEEPYRKVVISKK